VIKGESIQRNGVRSAPFTEKHCWEKSIADVNLAVAVKRQMIHYSLFYGAKYRLDDENKWL
jgi:hypothetical protein